MNCPSCQCELQELPCKCKYQFKLRHGFWIEFSNGEIDCLITPSSNIASFFNMNSSKVIFRLNSFENLNQLIKISYKLKNLILLT